MFNVFNMQWHLENDHFLNDSLVFFVQNGIQELQSGLMSVLASMAGLGFV